MAQSPAHKFGQVIGDVLEAAIVPLLEAFARKHDLYLDRKGPRPCRRGRKCTWTDLNGNAHDLDFVLERGGTLEAVGTPVAFIETAWRRYTKHSRNKVQEIQGAIEPLAETYRAARPFKGAILAGVFTGGAITQLKSLHFSVVYIPYESVVAVFRKYEIDAAFDENTPDREFQTKISACQQLAPTDRKKLASTLLKRHRRDLDQFFDALSVVVLRRIDRILIFALHGTPHEAASIDDAIRFIAAYQDDGRAKPIDRYEIQVRYSNGDQISGSFRDKDGAIEFLRTYQAAN
jgi:hypothetical protein